MQASPARLHGTGVELGLGLAVTVESAVADSVGVAVGDGLDDTVGSAETVMVGELVALSVVEGTDDADRVGTALALEDTLGVGMVKSVWIAVTPVVASGNGVPSSVCCGVGRCAGGPILPRGVGRVRQSTYPGMLAVTSGGGTCSPLCSGSGNCAGGPT